MDNKDYSTMLCISEDLCDPYSDLETWKVLFMMAAQGYADITYDDDGEVRIWSDEDRLFKFLRTNVDDFLGYEG